MVKLGGVKRYGRVSLPPIVSNAVIFLDENRTDAHLLQTSSGLQSTLSTANYRNLSVSCRVMNDNNLLIST